METIHSQKNNPDTVRTTKLRKRRLKSPSPMASSRWIAYVTAGVATTLATGTAEADIFYSGAINQHLQAPLGTNNFSRVDFQLDMPNFIRAAAQRSSGGNGGAFFAARGHNAGVAGFSASGYAYISRLSFGQAISGRPFLMGNLTGSGSLDGAYGALANGVGYPNSQWLGVGTTGFAGFTFDNGSGPRYGWIRFTMDGTPENGFTVVDYAYGDLNDSITAGQVPEPGSLGLLALGGGALLAWRQRRAKTKI